MSEIKKKDLISIRDGNSFDANFIRATWIKGFRYNQPNPDTVDTQNTHWMRYWIEELEQEVYLQNYKSVIEHIISKPNIKISIASLIDDPDVILGYSITEGIDILHWVFVRRDWRHIGLSHDLIPTTIKTITHLSDDGIKIKRKLNLTFNPWKI